MCEDTGEVCVCVRTLSEVCVRTLSEVCMCVCEDIGGTSCYLLLAFVLLLDREFQVMPRRSSSRRKMRA